MGISLDIVEEAKSILGQSDVVLPAGIKVGGADPVYFVCNIDDASIHAQTTIEYDGKIYKIGTKI